MADLNVDNCMSRDVVLHDKAHVVLHDKAHVVQHDKAHVVLHDKAHVVLHDKTHVVLHDKAHVPRVPLDIIAVPSSLCHLPRLLNLAVASYPLIIFQHLTCRICPLPQVPIYQILNPARNHSVFKD